MKVGWIDTHAHLAIDELLLDIDDIIKRAKANDVSKIIVIALTTDEIKVALNLKKKYPMLEVAAGFHPNDAHKIKSEDWKKLEKHLKQGDLLAIGEIGLDFYWEKRYKKEQLEVFKRQLRLANQYQLPVLIHMREATQMTFDVIEEETPLKGGIMHSYSGSVEMAKRFINKGFFISLSGPLTFKNANLNRQVAKALPLDRMFIETDSPYLTPEPYRGKRNEPSYVAFVGEKIASLRNIEESQLKSQMNENFHSLFS